MHNGICPQYHKAASQAAPVVKNLPANRGDARDGFDPRVGKIPWRRKWQSAPAFLPGKPHGQRSLASYSPQGCKELDTHIKTESFRS